MASIINDSNFKSIVLDSQIPVVVDFWATWCGPCRQIAPYVEELAQEYEGRVLVCKCDVDNANEIPATYGIRNIPTLLFIKNGQVIDKMVGAAAKSAIAAKINQLL